MIENCFIIFVIMMQVNLRFAKDADIVTVTGPQEKVEECIEHILNLEEEYVSYLN